MRQAVSNPVARVRFDLILPTKSLAAAEARINRHADGETSHQTLQNALTDVSDNVYSRVFDSAGETSDERRNDCS
jgi:hypothetical protein